MRIRNRLSLWVAVLALAGMAEARKPNIVFIMSDDQDWRHFGFMGGDAYTPNLDRMVDQGLYLTDFNVTTTVCSPSRYSFMTGRYAGRCTGEFYMRLHPKGTQTQTENNCELEPDRGNVAKVLQQNGYKTGFVGKCHLVKHDWLRRNNWKRFGFEEYPKDADPKDPAVTAKMQRNHQRWCDEIAKYGFDYVDGVYGANLLELYNTDLNVHNLEWTVDKALTFMESNQEEPFFLYFATTLQHGPTPKQTRFSLDADPRMSGEGYLAEVPDVMPSREDVKARNRKTGRKDDTACYLWLDDGVGAILNKLKELGLEEDTLVIFSPDHGYYRYAKSTLYDYGMRVPMLMQWKGTIKPGSTYDELAANIDIAPTLLDIAGIQPPADYEMDGVSLKKAILGKNNAPVREYLFSEMGYSRAVKSKDWKYIAIRYPEMVQSKIDRGETFQNYEDKPPLEKPYLTRNSHLGFYAASENPNYFDADQLYDLRKDKTEDNNIFDQYPEKAAAMQQVMKKALEQFPNRPFGEFTSAR